ncbi:MAG TPA: efflux RND transporter periplasmic adaptor subunit, partial [Burkholderiales bacterium]|nr:efflux RND transporter periplasmic adaptor subunit [Burkholderiales bacterium]
DPIKVDFRVPETFLRDLQVGQTVEINLDALPGKTYEGRVLAVNPLIDATGRALVVRAQVNNRDSTLRPGMFARVTVITRSKREALVVPEEALVPQGQDNYLFRIVDGKVSRVKVQVGQRRDSKVEIVAGIDKDAVIVTAGQAKLREGSAVKVAAREPAKAADSRKSAPES